MTHHDDELYQHEDSGPGFFSGLLVGGLIGAAAAILMAPRSGEETRTLLREKGIELKDQLGQAATEAQSRAQSATREAQYKAQKVMDEAQSVVSQKREQLERTAEAAKETWKEHEPVRPLGHNIPE